MKPTLFPALIALSCLVVASLRVLAGNVSPPSPVASSVNGLPTVSHVIFISCDGLRGDTLEVALNSKPLSFPNFNRLKAEGASTFRARTDYGFTETIPNHSSMITGRPVYEPGTTTQAGVVGHGQVNNVGSGVTGSTSVIHKLGGDGPVSSYKSSVFDVVHESGRSTAFFFSKDRLYFLVRSYNATYGADSQGVPGVINPARNKIDRASPATGFPANAVATGTAFRNDADLNGLAAFTMLHCIDPDTSVHSVTVTNGPGQTLSSWETAVRNCDSALGAVFSWLDAHPAEKACTAILLTGDHGGIGGSSSHTVAGIPENYTIPFFLWSPGIRPGSDAYRYFTNRTDPAVMSNRPTDLLTTVDNPPLRNGDIANLATSLMGLPSVPGSYFRPDIYNPDTTALLLITNSNPGTVQLSYPASATAFTLETAADLPSPAWSAIPAAANGEGQMIHTADATAERRFFRLRRK